MSAEEIISIKSDIETICCDGGQDSLGHPVVYYSFDDKNEIICSYCNKKYIKKEEAKVE